MSEENERRRFYGKYRGAVTDVQDPLKLGRIKARVPDVYGDDESGWALPCVPFVGNHAGFFALPGVNASVWIEFEAGDPDFPIWSGCWWGASAEMAPALTSPHEEKVLLQTIGGHRILLDDAPGSGGITLETAGGQKLKLLSSGIEIDTGQGAKITLNSGIKIDDGQGANITLQSSKVDVNSGALEVM